MSSGDPLARRLAAVAVGLALLALALSGYAISMSFQHRQELRSLGDVLHQIGAREVPLASPPAEIDRDDR
jgi:hypothetical protein